MQNELAQVVDNLNKGGKHFSSSSEEEEMGVINTSDEMETGMQVDEDRINGYECNNRIGSENFVGERLSEFCEGQRRMQENRGDREQQHSTDEIEWKAEREIKQAEAMKAKMNNIKGNYDREKFFKGEIAHSMFVDEDYSMMGGHVDMSTRAKIENNEYVNFSRLLPRDRLYETEEKRMELVNRNGLSYWLPIERDAGNTISSFFRWEQAFRIFSRIYTEKYPHKATELIQYDYIIGSASSTFTWKNVCVYDHDFRIHITRHPKRSWGVILQQAWSMRLRDRLSGSSGNASSNRGSSNNNQTRGNRNICYKYNRGRCTFGFNCKFDHKCAICGKWGHGAYNCRKASGAEKQQWTERNWETGETSMYYHNHDKHDKNNKRDRDYKDFKRK